MRLERASVADQRVRRRRFLAIAVIAAMFTLFSGVPLRAISEQDGGPFRIEIDLGAEREWILRTSGLVRIDGAGRFEWPFRLEGFSSPAGWALSHRPVTAPLPTPAFQAIDRPEIGSLNGAMFGYSPGDLVEIRREDRIRPLGRGGLDQVIAIVPGPRRAPLRLEIIGISPTIRIQHPGLSVRVDPDGGQGERLVLEPENWRKGALATEEDDQTPRLMVSNHADFATLGRALVEILPGAGPTTRERARLAAPRGAPTLQVVEALLALLPPDRSGSEPAHRLDIRSTDEIWRMGRASPLEKALLMRAMLAEFGLRADLLLSNRRPIRSFPLAPVGLFDTVLVSIADSDLVFDPSHPQDLAFGLASELGGRPALRLTAQSASVERLPLAEASRNRIFVRAEIQIDREGNIEGQSLTEATGPAAIRLRNFVQNTSTGNPSEGLARIMQRQMLEGNARFGPQDQRGDTLSQHLAFLFSAQMPDDTLLRVPITPGPRLYRLPLFEMLPALKDPDLLVLPCRGIILEQHLVFHLPDRRLLLEPLNDVAIRIAPASYEARYEVERSRLTVHRRLVFDPPDSVCTREQVRQLTPLIRAASQDLVRQMHLRLPPG